VQFWCLDGGQPGSNRFFRRISTGKRALCPGMPLDCVAVGLITRHGEFPDSPNLSYHCTLVLTFRRFLAALNVVST